MKAEKLRAGLALAALSLLSRPVMAANNHPVQGHVDGITTAGSGEVTLNGWACNTGWSWTSSQVDVYAGAPAGSGGTKLGVYQANQYSEPAVSQVCGTTGIYHRFVITLTISMRQQFAGKLLYVYGFALPGSGQNVLLNGSGLYAVPAAPAVADSTYYIHADRLGSNVVMTDANAKVVAKTEYTAYGAAVQNTSKDETAGYTGHYEDPLTGLTYMQARYYDADLGRFLSVDPVLSTPGDIFNFARYAYANNNPMMFTDPTGMVAAACRSDAVMNSDGSWSVTGSGCVGGSGGWGGVAGWFPGWGGGSTTVERVPSAGGGGGRPVTDLSEVTAVANRLPDVEMVKWTGTTWSLNFSGFGLSGGLYRFDLASECIGGEKQAARVSVRLALGGSAGLPASTTGSWVTFLSPSRDASAFNGDFFVTNVGAAMGVGYSRSGYKLGLAHSKPGGGIQGGFDWGAGMHVGDAKVDWSIKLKCN